MKAFFLFVSLSSQLISGGGLLGRRRNGNQSVALTTTLASLSSTATADATTTLTTTSELLETVASTLLETVATTVPQTRTTQPQTVSIQEMAKQTPVPSSRESSETKSSRPPSSINIITIISVIGGVIIFSILGIYVFRKTTLRKSNAFEKRLDPSYAPTLKQQPILNPSVPKLDNYIGGGETQVQSPPAIAYGYQPGYYQYQQQYQ